MRENEREGERIGGKRGGGGAAWANWAQGGRQGRLGRPGSAHGAGEREKEERERERKKKEKIFFEIRSFYMNAFALSKQSKEMQGSAWCIKQHKVFRVFLHGKSKSNPARTLEKVKV
jgi:hypothetical protein